MEIKNYLFEEWRAINGYEGLYEVSNYGRVRSIPNRGISGKYNGGKIKNPQKRGKYLYVRLYKNGVGKPFNIHRLVATAFIPNPNNYPCVDHIDTNCHNNRVSNLRWVSHSQNSRNPLTQQHMLDNRDAKGGKRASQLTYVYKDGKPYGDSPYKSQNETSRKTGVPRSTIYKCLKGLQETTKEGFVITKTPLN